jgi:quercetin dioxygenase-like cupin family protein
MRAWLGMGAALVAASAQAQDLGYPARTLLETRTDVLGQPIVYPRGAPRITSAIVTLAPGASGAPHLHEVPMYAFVLEGEITADYGEKGKRTFRKGEALIEAQNWPHRGVNTGGGPVTLLVVYIGGDGAANVAPAD